MSDCPLCYGQWSKTREKCKGCEFRVWCEDSSQIDKGLGCFSYDDVSYSETFASEPEQWKDETAERKPHKMLAELLHDLHDRPQEHAALIGMLHRLVALHRNSPLCFAVTLAKVLHPEMSYADIAGQYNTSKQLVAYHLNRAKTLIPQLESAILVDRRRLPHLNIHNSLTFAGKSLIPQHINRKLETWIIEKYGARSRFCTLSGIPESTFHQWLIGTKPRHQSRVKLADAMGLTLDELEQQFDI